MRADVVWYYYRGRWIAADPFTPPSLGGVGGDVAELVRRIQRSGYHAVAGQLAIGAPEGPPTMLAIGCACDSCHEATIALARGPLGRSV